MSALAAAACDTGDWPAVVMVLGLIAFSAFIAWRATR